MFEETQFYFTLYDLDSYQRSMIWRANKSELRWHELMYGA